MARYVCALARVRPSAAPWASAAESDSSLAAAMANSPSSTSRTASSSSATGEGGWTAATGRARRTATARRTRALMSPPLRGALDAFPGQVHVHARGLAGTDGHCPLQRLVHGVAQGDDVNAVAE